MFPEHSWIKRKRCFVVEDGPLYNEIIVGTVNNIYYSYFKYENEKLSKYDIWAGVFSLLNLPDYDERTDEISEFGHRCPLCEIQKGVYYLS